MMIDEQQQQRPWKALAIYPSIVAKSACRNKFPRPIVLTWGMDALSYAKMHFSRSRHFDSGNNSGPDNSADGTNGAER